MVCMSALISLCTSFPGFPAALQCSSDHLLIDLIFLDTKKKEQVAKVCANAYERVLSQIHNMVLVSISIFSIN